MKHRVGEVNTGGRLNYEWRCRETTPDLGVFYSAKWGSVGAFCYEGAHTYTQAHFFFVEKNARCAHVQAGL